MPNLPLERKDYIQRSYVRFVELVLLSQGREKQRVASLWVFWLAAITGAWVLTSPRVSSGLVVFPLIVAAGALLQYRHYRSEWRLLFNERFAIQKKFWELGLNISDAVPDYTVRESERRFVQVHGLDRELADPLSGQSYVRGGAGD